MWQLRFSSIARILAPRASCNMAFFRGFNPILARLQKTLSKHLPGDQEGTRALYRQRKFQRQRTSKASTARARNFSKCNRMLFLEFFTFLVIIVIEKSPTQGDSTQSKVSQKLVRGFVSLAVTVLQFFKSHENSKFQ